MFILQKVFGGQEAVEFQKDGSIKTYAIKPFGDRKYEPATRKESSVKKNTLAFYDAITNKFNDLDELIKTLGEDLCPFDYKSSTSYIGYLDSGYMQCLKLSFADQELADIALNADGNNINRNHKPTMNVVTNIIDMIEDDKCDFVNRLKQTFDDKQDKRFNFSKSLVDDIMIYHSNKKAYNFRCREGYRQDDSLIEDLDIFKRNFLSKIQSYKNFRELYRFRKQYLYEKEIEREMKAIAGEEEKPLTFEERYEEARQKTYPKQKTKKYEVPGQLSLFDTIEKK
jgi:hypothetical protein